MMGRYTYTYATLLCIVGNRNVHSFAPTHTHTHTYSTPAISGDHAMAMSMSKSMSSARSVVRQTRFNTEVSVSSQSQSQSSGRTLTSTSTSTSTSDRRDFISGALALPLFTTGIGLMAVTSTILGRPDDAIAADDDMTSEMFNEDGSLKEGVMAVVEAKDRSVGVLFPSNPGDTTSSSSSASAIVSTDGATIGDVGTTQSGISASYTVPDKWTSAPDYLDTLLAVRKKACDQITVYQVPGTFDDFTILENASKIGLSKALGFDSVQKGIFPKTLPGADIVSGRKVIKAASTATATGASDTDGEKRKYYEFDIAVAPDSCDGKSADNLGLGFCPYDTIVLISATIVDKKMMVCGVTSTKAEWKIANADLKRVRNSFFVEPYTNSV